MKKLVLLFIIVWNFQVAIDEKKACEFLQMLTPWQAERAKIRSLPGGAIEIFYPVKEVSQNAGR